MSNNRIRPIIERPGMTIGMTPTRPERTNAAPVAPNAVPSAIGIDRITEAFTYFTNANAQAAILYNGDREWAKITLLLETAGPVVVGPRADLSPILSGRGRLLITSVAAEFTIAKSSRLYILATAVNRVSITIEPLPWLEQIASDASKISRKP